MMPKDQNYTFHPTLLDRDVWVFDLDNTLYPAECDLFAQIDVRMGAFISDFLDVDKVEARRVQKLYLKDHGTTLKGLIENHKINPHDFLDYVHDIDFTPVPKDDALRKAIEALPGRKIIYTNGDKTYAEKVVKRLGIEGMFEDIHDIVAADLLPKPRQDAFDAFVSEYDFNPNHAVMVEDMVRNLIPAHRLGMGTVWVNTGCEWGRMDHDHKVVHAETEVLTPWLTALIPNLKP